MTDTCAIDAQAAKPRDESSFEPGPGKYLLFFGDPMCSWCWGFAPELRRIFDAVQGRAQFHMVMGGLRTGTTEPWDASMRSDIRHHWQSVAAKTGQPFDFSRLDDETFVYDTEPACRALVTVRTLKPDAALDMYDSLHRGFYALGLDITEPGVLADLARVLGVEPDRFRTDFDSAAMRRAVAFDFRRTQAFGVSGFPTVVCAEDGQYAFLTLGYRPYAALEPLLQEWLNA